MYGPGGEANTSMGLRGVDIGPMPNYWADFNRTRQVLRPPKPMGAMDQGQALAERPSGPQGAQYDYEPIYGNPAPTGFNMQGMGYREITPGQTGFQPGFGTTPVAIGYRQVRRQ